MYMMSRNPVGNLTLPGFDPPMKRCDLCGTPTLVLGQWSPFRHFMVCRACAEANPFPLEAYEVMHERGLVLDHETMRKREWVAGMENQMREAKAVRRKPRRVVMHHFVSRLEVAQLSIPVCDRCGSVHSRFMITDYAAKCPRCDAMETIESFAGRGRSILVALAGADDEESILDYLYQRNPEWFSDEPPFNGLMPDYWFEVTTRAKGDLNA